MEHIKIFIKNMVCDRCKRVVEQELTKLGYSVQQVELGEAELEANTINLEDVRQVLAVNGFELLDDRKVLLIEQVKLAVIELIHQQGEAGMHLNMSDYLAKKLGCKLP